MKPIPEHLRDRPFSLEQARDAKVSDRMLRGKRFVRIHPKVYRCHDLEMTQAHDLEAARLALPSDCHLTGISRIQQLGLDFGPRRPIRFVRQGKRHLALEGIFLHRTKRLPPIDDDGGVVPPAAFIAYCRRARVIDAIKVGDWLLNNDHMDVERLTALALHEPWRDGAAEAVWVAPHLDGASRSLKESETRSLLTASGLPGPEVNVQVPLTEDVLLIADLLYRRWRLVVEYEGRQHQDDRGQYISDLDRYAILRRHDVGYVQVTQESLARPQSLVGTVYRELVARGYDGPPPEFGPLWQSQFTRIHDLLAHDRQLARMGGGRRTVS